MCSLFDRQISLFFLFVTASASHGRSACFDRFNDVVVTRAAAQIAFEPFANFPFGGVGVFFHQIDRAHDHAWCTEPTLQAVIFPECFLHWMQCIAIRQAFDGADIGTIGLHCQRRAAFNRRAVNMAVVMQKQPQLLF
jgi:hypothetical protein